MDLVIYLYKLLNRHEPEIEGYKRVRYSLSITYRGKDFSPETYKKSTCERTSYITMLAVKKTVASPTGAVEQLTI